MFREMPPLQVPFGELTSSPGTNDLAKQRVGSIDTDLPLISFNKVKGTTVAVIFGEGLWRWRMIDFVKKESHARFDGILTKMVQFTANKEDRRQFRIKAPKNQPENERLLFEAEVYDETFQALTDPEVSLLIRDSEKREYPFTFSRGNGYYTLDAGSLPVGDYAWTAQVLVGGKTLTSEGQFSVYPLMLETAQTTANHKLLNQLAMTNGGEMVSASEVGALAGMITSNKNVTSIAYERNKMNDLIDVRWLLALILGLLSIEWLVRKRSGTY
jgi:hypothetical protein